MANILADKTLNSDFSLKKKKKKKKTAKKSLLTSNVTELVMLHFVLQGRTRQLQHEKIYSFLNINSSNMIVLKCHMLLLIFIISFKTMFLSG